MDQKSLEKNLANMERELVALQTAHDVGMGMVRYYEYDGYLNPTLSFSVVYILISIKSGERNDPLLQFYTSRNVALSGILRSNVYTGRYLGRGYCIEKIPSAWKIISTSQIEYEYSYDTAEAEEWIGEHIYE